MKLLVAMVCTRKRGYSEQAYTQQMAVFVDACVRPVGAANNTICTPADAHAAACIADACRRSLATRAPVQLSL